MAFASVVGGAWAQKEKHQDMDWSVMTDTYNVAKKEPTSTGCVNAKHTKSFWREPSIHICKHQQQAITSSRRMVWERGFVVNVNGENNRL